MKTSSQNVFLLIRQSRQINTSADEKREKGARREQTQTFIYYRRKMLPVARKPFARRSSKLEFDFMSATIMMRKAHLVNISSGAGMATGINCAIMNQLRCARDGSISISIRPDSRGTTAALLFYFLLISSLMAAISWNSLRIEVNKEHNLIFLKLCWGYRWRHFLLIIEKIWYCNNWCTSPAIVMIFMHHQPVAQSSENKGTRN